MGAPCSARGQATRASPYALLARVLRGLIERWGAPKEPWIVAELARLLPELGAAPNAKFQALQMQRAVARTIAATAESGMAGLVIDDVQFADDASIEILLRLMTENVGAGLTLPWLITVRANEIPAKLSEWKAKVDVGALVEIHLGPLDDNAVRVAARVARDPGLRRRRVGRADGAPYRRQSDVHS